MESFDKQLYEILKTSGFIQAQALDDAYKASQDINKPFSDILIFRGLCSEEMLGQLIADSMKVPYISLKNKIISDAILGLIPENLARRYRVVPLEASDSTITIATDDPEDIEALEAVRKRTGLSVTVSYATRGEISRALNQYKRDFKKKFESIVSENAKKATTIKELTIEQLLHVAQDIPIVKTFDALLEYAVAENASDIHIEQGTDSLLIRLRIDGVLHDIINLPKDIHPAIIARIKVLSNLQIDEHRVPQDGRFRFQIDETLIALRVSIIPGFYGENVVMRLLPESSRPLSMEELGITGKNNEYMMENIKKPYGMILVTGPTGSGKTTTLYSVLNILNTPRVNICTVEDPIEYGIARVNQIQVNPKTKLTFAAGLRALLRHDPDIIMVGEIRDEETASIAINSALTGHLVLSTIHTNNAISSIARFIDMGAKPYLLTSTLNMIIAQRLVRRICSACIVEQPPTADIQRRLSSIERLKDAKKNTMKFFKGKGCSECRNTGFRGRIGIYELLNIDDDIRELILEKASERDLKKMAYQKGMREMFDDGLDKVQAGLTTIEEVMAAVTA